MAEQHYFCIAPSDRPREVVTLDGAEFHHCVTVCRARVGDGITLIDGRGGLYEARIERIDAGKATLSIRGVTRAPEPPPVDIALGMLKAPRLDFAIEKCTELGLRTLILFISERSVRRAERCVEGAARDRMERKVVAACKQSGQAYFPAVEFATSVDRLVERFPSYGRVFIAEQHADRMNTDLRGISGAVLGVVGPEGGVSPAEHDSLVRCGATPLSLGASRLRSETAAVCLLYRLASDLREAHSGH